MQTVMSAAHLNGHNIISSMSRCHQQIAVNPGIGLGVPTCKIGTSFNWGGKKGKKRWKKLRYQILDLYTLGVACTDLLQCSF